MKSARSFGPALRAGSLSLMVLVVVAGLVSVRVVRTGEAELDRSTQAFNQGDLPGAVLHARRAATAYVPGAPHVSQARARLRAIAEGAEAQGDLSTARLAWGAIRTAALETRHFTSPARSELELADRQLERLNRVPAGPGTTTRRLVVGEHPGPRPGWAVAVALGFTLTVFALGWLGISAVGADGTLNPRRAALGFGLVAAGLACFSLALYWA